MLRNAMRLLGHLEWLRFGVRDRIIRLTHNPDICKPEEFVRPFFNGIYRGNFDTFIDWNVFYYGAYSREELRLIDDLLQTVESPIVLDVGANVGHHTLFAAMRSKRVICFEPFDDVATKIEQKIKDNNLQNALLIKCALGASNETAAYIKPSGHNTGTGSFVTDATEVESIKLPIRVGDEVLAEHEVHGVHFIKIDTEGFEPFVLDGLKSTLERCRPLVFFEWTPAEKKLVVKDFRKLFPAEYSFFQFLSDTVVLRFFRKPTYRLLPLADSWPDGNLLAVPNEYIKRLRETNPSCNAAKQIAGST